MAIEIEGRSLQGEFLRTARTVNTMVNPLSSFASEVTRVAREVGTEGLKVSPALGRTSRITSPTETRFWIRPAPRHYKFHELCALDRLVW